MSIFCYKTLTFYHFFAIFLYESEGFVSENWPELLKKIFEKMNNHYYDCNEDDKIKEGFEIFLDEIKIETAPAICQVYDYFIEKYVEYEEELTKKNNEIKEISGND